VVAMGDVNAGVAGMKANNQLAAYSVATKAVVVLANNAARAPAPTLDAKGKLLRFVGDADSLSGTFTAYSWTVGSAAATTIASKVRALVTSPDGMVNALITAEAGKTRLAAGPVGMPATEIGDFPATSLRAGQNVFFSGDGSRVYAIGIPVNVSAVGDLLAGTVGMAGARKISPGVAFASPDKSGKQAAVISSALARSGRALGIYRE